ncbi:hypothetical protein TRVA0_049S01024 [Trichomonascus vanleenenianus]|uniref:uncharacterized protein n=1 Tax=Trichomonascus vanleenenianus TaxID=2268995 RepID=UPI003ECB0D03
MYTSHQNWFYSSLSRKILMEHVERYAEILSSRRPPRETVVVEELRHDGFMLLPDITDKQLYDQLARAGSKDVADAIVDLEVRHYALIEELVEKYLSMRHASTSITSDTYIEARNEIDDIRERACQELKCHYAQDIILGTLENDLFHDLKHQIEQEWRIELEGESVDELIEEADEWYQDHISAEATTVLLYLATNVPDKYTELDNYFSLMAAVKELVDEENVLADYPELDTFYGRLSPEQIFRQLFFVKYSDDVLMMRAIADYKPVSFLDFREAVRRLQSECGAKAERVTIEKDEIVRALNSIMGNTAKSYFRSSDHLVYVVD